VRRDARALRVESREVKVTRISEMLELDVAQSGKDALGASGVRVLPGPEHLLDGDALHVVLRATQPARNDWEAAATRVALDVTLGDVGERADDDMPSVL